MARYQVIGQCEVDGVKPGGIVTPDPAVVNVDALVEGGHLRLLPERSEQPERAARRSDRGEA